MLTDWMCAQFEREGASIARVYFLPFHPTAGFGVYKRDDVSRKPRPGMILQAQHDLNLDLKNSILVGDRKCDIQAGIAAGVGCNILFKRDSSVELSYSGYHRISSLIDALPFLAGSQSLVAE